MVSPLRELEILRFLRGLRRTLVATGDERTVIRVVVREAARMVGARGGVLLRRTRRDRIDAVWRFGTDSIVAGDRRDLRAYLDLGEWPRPPATRLMAPVPRRQRPWAVLVLDSTEPFPPGEGEAVVGAADLLAERLRELDVERASQVRARIDRKIMAQLRPQDLCYQILHGLRSLTGYDHSGALLVADGGGLLKLAAEQVAWSKRKSERIGMRVDLSVADADVLRRGQVCGFDRHADGWCAWLGDASDSLAGVVEESGEAMAGSVILAPLRAGGDELLGVVKVASGHARALGRYEADLLRRFSPQASVAIRNAQRAESLRENVLRAERKHAMADLARGVAHDVNNALGAVLPVVQQLRTELAEGDVQRDVLRQDLAHVEAALITCRRIFAGMLDFARGAAGRRAGRGDLRRAVVSALTILGAQVGRRGVEVEIDLPDDAPAIACAQHELEQLFLNLMSNACDSMSAGGRLQVSATPNAGRWTVRVIDTGCGMSAEELARIDEVFYTTKIQGHGLGLPICRSIITDMGAQMSIDSRAGVGTTVRLELPVMTGDVVEAKTP